MLCPVRYPTFLQIIMSSFFLFFFCVTGLDSAVRVFFLLFPQLIYMGLLLLLYIARSFCYFVRPLQIVRPALPTVDDADLLPIFN